MTIPWLRVRDGARGPAPAERLRPARSAPARRPSRRAGAGRGLPADGAALVLRVEYVGGFVTPSTWPPAAVVSVYADGRVITDGPVRDDLSGAGPAERPGAAARRRRPCRSSSTGRGRRASRRRRTSASPPIADAPSTRFTLSTADGHGRAGGVRAVRARVEGEARRRAHRGAGGGPQRGCGELLSRAVRRRRSGPEPDRGLRARGGRRHRHAVDRPGGRPRPPRAAVARSGAARRADRRAAGRGLRGCDRGAGARRVLAAAGGGERGDPVGLRTAPAGRWPSGRCCPTSPAAPTCSTDDDGPGPPRGGPGPSRRAGLLRR